MPLLTTPQGAAIAYDTFGDLGDPPLVLIQGLSAQYLGWRPGFCELLAADGFHVIRLDNRDVGQSQRYPEGGYTMADLATDTAGLLDGLGIEAAHIVGQSMGGMVAQALAIDHPTRVRSLGLVYTAASVRFLVGADAVAERMAVPPPRTRDEFIAAYVAGEVPCASPGYPQDTAWLADLGGQMYDRGTDEAGVERQVAATLGLPDRTSELRGITVPTTILAGDGDRLIDHEGSAELHELIPGSTLTIFPGMGHELPQPLWVPIVRLLGDNARRAG